MFKMTNKFFKGSNTNSAVKKRIGKSERTSRNGRVKWKTWQKANSHVWKNI